MEIKTKKNLKNIKQLLFREKKASKFINFFIEIREDISSMKQKQDVIENKIYLENKELLEMKSMISEMRDSIEYWKINFR